MNLFLYKFLIKNILPVFLYDCKVYAGRQVADIDRGNTRIDFLRKAFLSGCIYQF